MTTDTSRLARRVSARKCWIERMTMAIRRWLAVTAVASAYFAAFAASAQLLKQGDDALRPLYAQASDIAEGKDLATSSCAKCHGGDGIATDRVTPNLAGQRPAYLYLELKAYQAGARSNAETSLATRSMAASTASGVCLGWMVAVISYKNGSMVAWRLPPMCTASSFSTSRRYKRLVLLEIPPPPTMLRLEGPVSKLSSKVKAK